MPKQTIQREFTSHNIRNIRLVLGMLFVLQVFLGLADGALLQSHRALFLGLRLGAFQGVVVVLIALSRGESFDEWFPRGVVCLYVLAAVTNLGIIFFGRPTLVMNYHYGLLAILMAIYIFPLVWSPNALILSMLTIAAYMGLAVTRGVPVDGRLGEILFVFVLSVLFSFLIARQRDALLLAGLGERRRLSAEMDRRKRAAQEMRARLGQESKVRRAAEEELHYLEFHDALTGVYNRAYMDYVIIPHHRDFRYPVSVVACDINGLRLINRALGHDSGDLLLLKLVSWLREAMPYHSVIVRSDGDEFLVITEGATREGLAQFERTLSQRSFDAADELLEPDVAFGSIFIEEPGDAPTALLVEVQSRLQKNKLTRHASKSNHILKLLKASLRSRTHETEEHISRLEQLCFATGTRLGLSHSELNELALAAELHDIGKIAVPVSVLEKKGRLTDEEWEQIKRHSKAGHDIALSVPELSHVAEYILHHHERWDGGGYPGGLSGEEIPLISRIILCVDAYDVMTHERAYKEAYSHEHAVEELTRNAGTQFDPQVVQALLSSFEQEEAGELA